MFALLALLSTSTAQTPPAPKPAAAIELPMKLRGAMPAVEVRVNGEGPFLFAIDTCASGMGRVDSSLVQKLGLEIVGQASGSDGSGKGTPMTVARIDYLELGALAFENLDLPSRDYNRGDLAHIDGILGFELFAKGVLTLDFPAKIVRFEPGATLPEADGKHVLALTPAPVATFELTVAGEKVPAHIDSGNLIGRFVLPDELVAKLTPTGEPRSVGKAHTVSGETDILAVPIRETLAIGAFEFPGEAVVHPSPGPANVGAAVLADFRVSFDQAHARVRFER